MAQWPTSELVPIPSSGASWPARSEVGPLTRIGPTGENQQPQVLDQRTETIRIVVNQLVDMLNRIRDFFLDRDGATGSSTQAAVWMRGDMDMGGFKIVHVGAATTLRDLVTREQMDDVQFEAEDELEQILDSRVFKLDGSAEGIAPLNMGTQRVINLAPALIATDMMRKDTVDTVVFTLQTTTLLARSGSVAMTADLSFDGPLPIDPGFIPFNVADPTTSGDLVNLRYLNTQVSIFGGQDVPVGTILPFAGSTIPTNFLLCDGREVSRFVYQNLFNTIGIAYGSPSSSSVFKLPDLRGRVIIGKDNMGGAPADRVVNSNADIIGGKMGEELHVLTIPEIPGHTHTYDDHVFATGSGAVGGGADGTDANNVQTDTVRTSGSKGSGTGHSTVQPSRTQNFIVRH